MKTASSIFWTAIQIQISYALTTATQSALYWVSRGWNELDRHYYWSTLEIHECVYLCESVSINSVHRVLNIRFERKNASLPILLKIQTFACVFFLEPMVLYCDWLCKWLFGSILIPFLVSFSPFVFYLSVWKCLVKCLRNTYRLSRVQPRCQLEDDIDRCRHTHTKQKPFTLSPWDRESDLALAVENIFRLLPRLC